MPGRDGSGTSAAIANVGYRFQIRRLSMADGDLSRGAAARHQTRAEIDALKGAIGTADQQSVVGTSLKRARLDGGQMMLRGKFLQMLREEYRTAREELLWRLNGIYDVQKTALPLIIALMAALAWAGAEPGKFPKASLLAGWLLIPFFFSLARTKIRHHRQRNKELALYIKLIEMIMYNRFPHVIGHGRHGLTIRVGSRDDGSPEYVHFGESDFGWEHFIRLYRHLLPQLVRQLEKEEEVHSRELAKEYGLPKPIESMSHIELRYMNIFWAFAFSVSAFQVFYIVTGMDLWNVISTELSNLVMSR
jgi:hypothetical protein